MPTIFEDDKQDNKNQPGFKDLMQFPAVIDFRIIIDALEENGLDKLKAHLNKLTNGQCQEVKGEPRVSSNGKYVSYTLPAKVESAELLKSVYKAMGDLPFVKHIL